MEPSEEPLTRLPEPQKKAVAFRFDIDTIACAREGVPNLLELAGRYGVAFSFYVNLGRSISWGAMWRKRRRVSTQPATEVSKLSPFRKVGLRDIAVTLLLNPRIGSQRLSDLEAILRAGHELGLHGGTNHAVWQHELDTLSAAQLADLFDPAYREFHSRFGRPQGFASPGFVHDRAIYDLLEANGFDYVSDCCAEARIEKAQVGGATYSFWQVPVNVYAPGNVPILEAAAANRDDAAGVVAHTLGRVGSRPWSVIYGHPCFEGKAGLGVFERLLEACAATHEVVTVRDLVARTTRGSLEDRPDDE